MIISFSSRAWEQYRYWQETDRKTLKQLNNLIEAVTRNPHEGIGDPEALRFDFPGYWSRRIDKEHRLIYKVEDDTIYIVQCRYHYEA